MPRSPGAMRAASTFRSCRWKTPRPRAARLEPEALNETNKLELYVFASDKYRQAILVARLDNLGKGASGAAVQNMRLMLGLPEA